MPDAFQCFRRIATVASLLALCGCGTIGDAFYAVSFERAKDVSGITKGQQGNIALILRNAPRYDTGPLADDALSKDDLDKLKVSLDPCYAKAKVPHNKALTSTFIAPFASVAVTFIGTAVYNFVVERLQAEADKLQEESSKSYGADVVATTDADSFAPLDTASCIRETTVAGAEENSASTKPGLILLLRRIEKGGSTGGSTWAITYVWVGNAVAVTAQGKDGKLPTISVTTSLTISAPVADPEGGSLIPVKPIFSVVFDPIKAQIGATAKVCPPEPESKTRTCQYESDLGSNIPPGLSALQVAVGITETGDAANAKKRAEAGIKALNETVKPTYTTLVGMLANAVKGE